MGIKSNIGGFAIAGVMIAVGGVMTAKSKANAIETFGLNAPQAEFLESCKNDMKYYRQEFKHGASNIEGCACLARKVGDSVDNSIELSDYDLSEDAMEAILEAAKYDNVDMYSSMDDIAKENGVSAFESMAATSLLIDGLGECGKRDVVETYKANHPQVAVAATPAASQSAKPAKASKKKAASCKGVSSNQRAQMKQVAKERGLVFNESTCKLELKSS